jgi:hypothetical protein
LANDVESKDPASLNVNPHLKDRTWNILGGAQESVKKSQTIGSEIFEQALFCREMKQTDINLGQMEST